MLRFPKRYAIYDTETTGLDITKVEVIELAVKIVDPDAGREETYSWLVRPKVAIPAEITEITGITQEMVNEKGVPIEDALTGFIAATSGFAYIGHNILRFDNPIMERLLTDYTLTPGVVGDVLAVAAAHGTIRRFPKSVDTAALFKARELGVAQMWHEDHRTFAQNILDLRAPGVKFNLMHACGALGIDTSDIQAHRAAADVELVDRLYRKLIS